MASVTDRDAMGNPFEDLLNESNNNDTDVELSEPVAMPPALPPLIPGQQAEEVQQQGGQMEEARMTSTTTRTKVSKSFKSTLVFRTDLPKSARDAHPCGVLHFTCRGGPGAPAEEHAFAWISRQDDPSHLEAVLGHMRRFGFASEDAVFVPYSSRRSWIEKYPLAFPHVHCGEDGKVTGFPYWSGGRGGGIASSAAVAGALAGAPPSGMASNRGRKKKKIFPTAHLSNDMRDELHVEMFKYFRWLGDSLEAAAAAAPTAAAAAFDATSPAGDLDANRKLVGSAAGVDMDALQNLLENVEATFKVVRNSQPAMAAAAATAMGGTGVLSPSTGVLLPATTAAGPSYAPGPQIHGMMPEPPRPSPAAPAAAPTTLPFLEEALGEPLGRLAEANKKNPHQRSARKGARRLGLDFEDMYERLLLFHQANGHANVPQKWSQDGQLGSWVANMRSKRKQMAKKGQEFEADVTYDDDDDEDDDDDDDDGALVKTEGSLELAGKKRKRMGGRQRLTRERVHRLDSVGFQWIVANPNTKSWEERFEDLKEYQQMHGTTRVPRSSGTLGEWVHMQRRLYNKKDKNFMARRAPLLDNIGFEWHPRKHALVSWEDNFNRLVEFGRMNRHYNVQSPFPEGYAGDFEDQDGELVEAHRFSKWVRRIHAEYRAYASGKGSRMLNDARVMQLREIGFQFA